MQIEIEGEAAAILERVMELGCYASPQQAVEAALRRTDAEQVAWMRARVQEALDEGGEGTLEELDREMEELFARLEKDYP